MTNRHPKDEIEVENESVQFVSERQRIEEEIIIKDSCDVEVLVKDKQFALSLQAGLQALITVILNEYTGSYDKAREISNELFQIATLRQTTKQKFLISHSKNIKVKSFDEQADVNIQVLVQLLAALLVKKGVKLGEGR